MFKPRQPERYGSVHEYLLPFRSHCPSHSHTCINLLAHRMLRLARILTGPQCTTGSGAQNKRIDQPNYSVLSRSDTVCGAPGIYGPAGHRCTGDTAYLGTGGAGGDLGRRVGRSDRRQELQVWPRWGCSLHAGKHRDARYCGRRARYPYHVLPRIDSPGVPVVD